MVELLGWFLTLFYVSYWVILNIGFILKFIETPWLDQIWVMQRDEKQTQTYNVSL